jgi:hypothetical protein
MLSKPYAPRSNGKDTKWNPIHPAFSVLLSFSAEGPFQNFFKTTYCVITVSELALIRKGVVRTTTPLENQP